MKFPVTNVRRSSAQRADKTLTTKIIFSYKGQPYGVIFINNGVDQGDANDTNERGKVGLLFGGETVLGLDIARDLAKRNVRWRWQGVFAFAPGDWMKDLTEMAAHIDGHMEHDLGTLLNNDALERARKIKLQFNTSLVLSTPWCSPRSKTPRSTAQH